MKTMLAAITAVIICSSSALAAAAKSGDFGIGAILGSPTGFTAKYWADETLAIDGGVGFGNAAVFYADVLFNTWKLIPEQSGGKFNGYLGLGPRLATDDDGQFAIRTVAGLGFWPSKAPIEIFVEMGPTFKVVPDDRVGIDGGLGLRFYFR